jgi:hypothetical protein
VPKLNGKLRIYIDYRQFNATTVKNRYILWWGDVDHHGLGLFRHLDEGLAAPLYLGYDPWSSSSQQTIRHRFTENETSDCWLSDSDWILYWLPTRSVSSHWLSLRESCIWLVVWGSRCASPFRMIVAHSDGASIPTTILPLIHEI